jgi:hypothetical protein
MKLTKGLDVIVGSDDAVGVITALDALIERTLTGRHQSRCCDEGYAALCDRLAQRRVRDRINAPPGINLERCSKP